MASPTRDQLLQLPEAERADLALLLWESLGDEQKAAHFDLDGAQRAELDRRWEAHLLRPDDVLTLDELRRSLPPRK
ncbi:MAG: addiction module protein [Terriglobales bacterium]